MLASAAKWLVASLPVCMVAGRSAMEVCFALLALLFLVHCVKHREWRWFRPTWVKLALGCWLYLLCLSIVNLETADNLDRGLYFGRFLFGALAIQWALSADRQAAGLLFKSLCVCVLFIVFDVFYQYCAGADLFGRKPKGVRLTGPFSDLRAGGMLLWMSFPVLVWFAGGKIIEAKPFLSRALSSLVIVGCVAAIFVSGERMALLMALFGLSLVVVLSPMKKSVLVAASLLGLAFVVALGITNQKIVERQFASSKTVIMNFADSQYGQLWRNGVKIGMQNPLFGVGPRNFRQVCPALPPLDIGDYPVRIQCSTHPHNIYIEWFAETGLLGLALFLALSFLWLKTLFKARRVDRRNLVLTGLTISVIIRLWPVQTTGSFFSNSSALPFWIMLGWALAMANEAMRKAKAERNSMSRNF